MTKSEIESVIKDTEDFLDTLAKTLRDESAEQLRAFSGKATNLANKLREAHDRMHSDWEED